LNVQKAWALVPDAERAEVHPEDRVVDLAADPGGEEIVLLFVGDRGPGRRAARELGVELPRASSRAGDGRPAAASSLRLKLGSSKYA
jgi:hypothetical protein